MKKVLGSLFLSLLVACVEGAREVPTSKAVAPAGDTALCCQVFSDEPGGSPVRLGTCLPASEDLFCPVVAPHDGPAAVSGSEPCELVCQDGGGR